MATRITVGFVQIYSALNMNRQRPDEERLAVSPEARRYKSAERRDSAPASWVALPYAVGLLQAYAERHAAEAGRFRFLSPLVDREEPARTAERLAAADVVALSVYVWNVRHSLAVAREVKRRRPETLVVLGGPQVPDRAEAFLRQNPQVDAVIHGEGEVPFLGLLEAGVERQRWEEVPSLTWLGEDGALRSTPRAPRIQELETVPSPYLSGVFDEMFADRPGAVWMGLLETNRGCPFQCTFCDWGSAVASTVRNFDEARVRAEIEWLARHGVEYVFCCDANFGMLPRDVGIAEHVAEVHRATGRPVTFATQATKNATERSYRVQKTLAESGVQGAVTVSLQSLDRHALELVKRANISTASFMELQRRYVRDGIPTYTDMILGLPGETYESWVGGLSKLIASGQHDRVSFYNCAVLPNAEMGDPAYQQAHGMRLVSQRIIETHAGLAQVERQPVAEYLDVVVETAALPAADWRRARVFAWLLELCYYDRLMQIPWALAGGLWQVDVRSLVEALLDADPAACPIVAEVRERFAAHARALQEGASDLLPSPEYLGIYWPLDQLTLIELVAGWRLDAFYDELAQIGAATCAAAPGFDPELWREAVAVNRALLRLPFQILDGLHTSSWDPVGLWRAHTAGETIAPVPSPCRYHIQRARPPLHSLDAWCEFLVLCQNNKPGYLYRVEVEDGTVERAAPQMPSEVPA